MPDIKSTSYPYDLIGNIAIVKFSEDAKAKEKKDYAKKLMLQIRSIKTVLEKTGKFKGRLRKQETKHIAGEKNKEALYRENNCVFRFNVDKSYFSPRLSNERKEIASQIKKGDEVLVMFAGVGPFTISIAKNTQAKIVYHNEINREANNYAKLNMELNKVKNKVIIGGGDIKRVALKLNEEGKKFDVIVMPRPNLKDSFLKEAFSLSKKGTQIFYYDFCKDDEKKDIIEKIKQEAEKAGKKIRILKSKIAGDIGPYKIRIRVDFRVL